MVDDSEIKMMLEPHLLRTSVYKQVQLNQKPFENNMGMLSAGGNELSFMFLMKEEDKTQYNQFILSSNSDRPFQINQCVAIENSGADYLKAG